MEEREFAADYHDGVLVVLGSVADQGTFLLRNALREHSQDFARGLVVDLSEVDYLPSVGVGVLAKAMGQARQHDETISLVAAQGSVAHRVLSVSGMPFRDSRGPDDGDDDSFMPA